MRMSDIVSNANVADLPVIALLIFLGVFAAVMWRVFRPASRARLEREQVLPLEDGVVVSGAEVLDGQA